MLSIKAVIFDLDGTLADSVRDIADTMNALLQERGRPGFGTDEFRQWIGGGSAAMVRRIADLRQITDGEAFLATYLLRYGENVALRTRLYDGVGDMLQSCIERRLPMALLSNKDEAMVMRLHRALFAKDVFDEVLGVSTAFPKKPDPQSSLHIARRLNASPEECLFVGDTRIDMATARAAGMRFAAALWGYGSSQELMAARPDFSFASPTDFASFIRAQVSARRDALPATVS
ncbi:HAD family hydrolase [Breoghania sp. JC706]|uniref:HAD family hydrolase n=1 Tax=Breoghania sp. JC706 TaxID=3117732 RepID=UPI00300BB60E